MAVTARLYPGSRAAAFSVLTLLGALAGPLFYPLAGWLVEAMAWRDALPVLALVMLACVLPAALLVRTRRAEPSSPAEGTAPEGTAAAPSQVRLTRELLEPRIYLLLGMVGCMAFAAGSLTLYQVPAMQATGLTLAAASSIAGLRGLFQFAGRVFLGPLVAWAGLIGAIGLCYAFTIGGVGMLIAAGPWLLVIGFIATTGVALGLLSPLHGLFATEVYGESRLGTLMGVQQVTLSVGGAAGPWMAGLTLDATGSYRAVMLLSAAASCAALAFLAAHRRTRDREAAVIAASPRRHRSAER